MEKNHLVILVKARLLIIPLAWRLKRCVCMLLIYLHVPTGRLQCASMPTGATVRLYTARVG